MKQLIIVFFIFFISQVFGQNWEQIGPDGGYFKEFTYDPNNPLIIYAGSDDGGGIWKSTNGGQDWNLLTADYPNMTGWSITIDSLNTDTIFACDVYGRYGLLKSTDGGTSWNQIVNGLSSQYDLMVSGLTIKTVDTLFISTGESESTTPPRPGNGVFKSFDGGNSWSPAGLQGNTVLSIGNNVFGTIFAGTESNGLQFSNDNGTNWSSHPQILSSATVFEIEVINNVIVVASNAGVYLSTNWGIDFINTGLVSDFNFDVFIQSTSPSIEFFGSTFSGLQKYSSTTSSWSLVSDPLLNNKLVIGIGASDNNVIIGTFSNGPLYLSNDSGNSWNTTNSSPTCTEINDLIVDPNNSNRMMTCLLGTYNIGGNYNDQCIYETTTSGSSWTRKGPKAHALCLNPNPLDFEKCYLGTFSKGLYKSNDGFNNYENLISGNKLIGDIAISSVDTSVLIVSEIDLDMTPVQASIKRSTDGGNNFTVVSSAATNRLLFNSSDNDTVYAATTNGIIISTDFGLTWSPWYLRGTNVLSIGYFNSNVYAGSEDGKLYKINETNAIDISGVWQTPVQIKSIYSFGNKLFVGLNGAEQDTTNALNGSIWESDNDGTSWSDLTSGMTSTNVYGNNVITNSNNDLLVATYGGGIFKASDITLNLSSFDQNSIVNEVYPNPAHNYFTVNSSLGNITSYYIVDMNGLIISSEIMEGIKSPNLTINTSELKSGIYTILIKLDNNETISNKLYKQ